MSTSAAAPRNGGSSPATTGTDATLPPIPQAKVPVSMGPRGLTFATLDEMWRFAVIASQSEVVPKEYRNNPYNCFIVVQFGLELGLPPMQSLQNIASINGKPQIYGDMGLAICEASGELEDFQEFSEGGELWIVKEDGSRVENDQFKAVCIVKRKGRTPARQEFSVLDAKVAGLWGKTGHNGQPTPWITNPKRMLQWRPRWFALRDRFADHLKGVGMRELSEEEAIETTARPVDPAEAAQSDALRERIQATQEAPNGNQGTAAEATDTAEGPEIKVAPDSEALAQARERVNRLYDALEALKPTEGRNALWTAIGKQDLVDLDLAALGEAEAYLRSVHDKLLQQQAAAPNADTAAPSTEAKPKADPKAKGGGGEDTGGQRRLY